MRNRDWVGFDGSAGADFGGAIFEVQQVGGKNAQHLESGCRRQRANLNSRPFRH